MDTLKIIISILLITLFLCANCAFAKEVFKVQQANSGHLFFINDNQFSARSDSNCSHVTTGDPVRFVEGSPSGVCITATFIDLRTGRACDVWCH